MGDIMQSCLHDASILGDVVLTSYSVLEHHSHQVGSVLGTNHLEVTYGNLLLHVHPNSSNDVVDVCIFLLEVYQCLDVQILQNHIRLGTNQVRVPLFTFDSIVQAEIAAFAQDSKLDFDELFLENDLNFTLTDEGNLCHLVASFSYGLFLLELLLCETPDEVFQGIA